MFMSQYLKNNEAIEEIKHPHFLMVQRIIINKHILFFNDKCFWSMSMPTCKPAQSLPEKLKKGIEKEKYKTMT